MSSDWFIKSINMCQTYLFKRCLHTSYKVHFAWPQHIGNANKEFRVNKNDLYGNGSETRLDYMRSLNINAKTHSLRLTNIVCTIGPATADVKMLKMLMEAGMNIARLNFSHGTHEYHFNTVQNLRRAVECYSDKIKRPYPLAIALDTKGPEIRTGVLDGENRDVAKEVELKKGEIFRLTTDKEIENVGSSRQVYVNYANIVKVVKKNDRIYIDDGLLLLIAEEVGEKYIDCRVEDGGMLGSRKGVNLPGVDVDLPAVSEKDKSDLRFAVEHDLDMVFASFIREPSAIGEIRTILGEQGKHILIVPKIENHQGVENLQSIIDVSDGIMVARGDLGIEIPPEKVFLAQKSILAQCNIHGKPGICATQMMESMTNKPRATKAECSDVANAVMDGADCVMLSGETAKGKYPIECVRVMDKLCREAESAMWRKEFFRDIVSSAQQDKSFDISDEIAIAAVEKSNNYSAAAIIVMSPTGHMARVMTKYRPRNVILTVTNDPRVARQCHLYRGLVPVLLPNSDCVLLDQQEQFYYAFNFGKCHGIISSGDIILLVKEPSVCHQHYTHAIQKFFVI